MKCSIDGCPGEYEARKVMHAGRHEGQVIDHVPADACSVCGDVLPKPDLKELLLAPEAHTEALTPPREKRRHRISPSFE